jgi:23S rRNA (guanosine2251-2'-O)-methyltransferase
MAPAGYGDRVEGVHAVAAAVDAGRVEKVYIEESRRSSFFHLLGSVADLEVVVIDDAREMAETRAPQGIVARCRPIMPVSLESLATDDAALIALDHVEDPQNVGAVVRSAAAAGATGLVMSSRRAAPLSATAFKAAAGTLERMPVAVVGSIPEALSRLKDAGVWVVGLDPSGDQSLFGLDLLTEPVAMVIGSEGSGIAPLTAKRCDLVASIPMAEGVESLNTSVSGALAAFEIMRVRSDA